jgi:hypothetical protein
MEITIKNNHSKFIEVKQNYNHYIANWISHSHWPFLSHLSLNRGKIPSQCFLSSYCQWTTWQKKICTHDPLCQKHKSHMFVLLYYVDLATLTRKKQKHKISSRANPPCNRVSLDIVYRQFSKNNQCFFFFSLFMLLIFLSSLLQPHFFAFCMLFSSQSVTFESLFSNIYNNNNDNDLLPFI